MAELRIGLIGCGGIGGVHAKSWAKVEGARIAAACDAVLSRAESVVEATNGKAFLDASELISRCDLDAIDICTPPNLHADAAIAALQKGIPTLCEKPLARNPEEARRITEAASASGTLLMTAFCHRFEPSVEYVLNMIQSGTLGRVLMFRNRFGTRFAGVEQRWFANVEVAGGGALMDTSVHSVDLFRYLVGEVAASSGALAAFNPAISGLEDSGAMLLTSVDGAIGVIEASWMTPWSANVVEIYGEKGAAVISYDTGETRYRLEGDADWTLAQPEPGDRFVRELEHFAAVVRGDEQLRMTGHDGLRAVEIIHAAYDNRLR